MAGAREGKGRPDKPDANRAPEEWPPPTAPPTWPPPTQESAWQPPTYSPLAPTRWQVGPISNRPRALVGLLAVLLLVSGAIGAATHSATNRGSHTAGTAPSTPTTPALTAPPGTGLGAYSCADPATKANPALSRAVIGPPSRFRTDTSDGEIGLLNVDEVADLSAPQSAGVKDALESQGFLEGVRRAYSDGGDGLQVEIRVYEFSCPDGASEHLAIQSGTQFDVVDPVTIAMSHPAGAVGWAAAGPDQDDAFDDVAAATLGNYYVAVYLVSARAIRGTYAASLLQTQVSYLQALSASPAATAPVAPAPTVPLATLKTQSGQPPICPPATSTLTIGQVNALMPRPPPGFDPLSDSSPPSGPITINQLSASSSVPALAAALNRSEGYIGGYVRAWEQSGGGGQLQVELHDFTCPEGVKAFAQQNRSASTYTSFRVTDGISGALGYISKTTNSLGHYRQVISASVGHVYLIVVYYTPSRSTLTLEQLAAAVAEHVETAERTR